MIPHLGLLILPFLLGSCINLRVGRTRLEEPIDQQALTSLAPGAPLQECLDRLGAPLSVWELPAGGVGCAYGSSDSVSWGFSISFTFDRSVPSTSLTWDDEVAILEGAVLLFGTDLRLRLIRRGRLAELVPERRRRPQPPDQGS